MTTYPRTVTGYQDLITSEHSDKPNYMATIAALMQPFVDIQNVLASLPAKFDIDTAVGDQLDKVGEWIGKSRFLVEPLTGIFFSWDTVGLGWDQAAWQGPYDPSTQLVALDDTHYRLLLYAQRELNDWNGSIPGIYDIYAPLIGTSGAILGVQDTQRMQMYLMMISPGTLDLITQELIKSLNIEPRPVGVGLNFIKPSVPGTPIFGFDITDAEIAGWDVGSWAVDTSGNPI